MVKKQSKPKSDIVYITKSTALTKYHLAKKDLIGVPCIEKKNPHYRCAGNMQLYALPDIIAVFKKKHGDFGDDTEYIDQMISDLDDERDAKRAERDTRKQAKNKTRLDKSVERRSELTEKLSAVGLQLRADSKLCSGYIDATITYDIDTVVDRMCQMKYLFDYCDLNKYIQIAKKERNELWRDFRERDDEPLLDAAERMVLEEIGTYPVKWPWL